MNYHEMRFYLSLVGQATSNYSPNFWCICLINGEYSLVVDWKIIKGNDELRFSYSDKLSWMVIIGHDEW